IIMLQKLNDQDYFKIKAVSSHTIMSFFFPQTFPQQEPKFFQLGTYVHAKFLELPEISEEIIQSKCKDLTAKDKADCDLMIDKLAKNEKIASKMPSPEDRAAGSVFTEVVGSYTYVNKKGALLPVKGKFDLINTKNNYVVDVKTTGSLATFEDSVVKFAYQIQAAFYLRLANLVHNTDQYKDFYWAIVDKKTLATDLIRCPDDLIENGNYYIDLYLENPPSFLAF
ncbi:MAG: PD-(D/E)XK nuclease-like domain-containing protein, partial [Thermoplasmatales archaeon]